MYVNARGLPRNLTISVDTVKKWISENRINLKGKLEPGQSVSYRKPLLSPRRDRRNVTAVG